MTETASNRTPPLVLALGRLGLVPFVAPGVIGLIWPETAPWAGTALAAYAALILSFLSGGRWGMAVTAPAPDRRIVSLAMLPSLAGLALLMVPEAHRAWQLGGLAAAHVIQGVWDLRSSAVPAWYAGLRGQLTLGAVAGLVLGMAVLR